MIIKVWGESGMVGGDRVDVIEVPDDATDEQIEDEAREWFFNLYNYGWEKAATQ